MVRLDPWDKLYRFAPTRTVLLLAMDFSGINPQTARMFLPLLQQIANSETAAGHSNDLSLSHESPLREKGVTDSEDICVDRQPSHFNTSSSSIADTSSAGNS